MSSDQQSEGAKMPLDYVERWRQQGLELARSFPSNAWEWFFGQRSGYPLAIIRIIFGAVLFIAYCQLGFEGYLEMIFGPDGMSQYTGVQRGKIEPTLVTEHLYLIWGLTLLAAFCFCIGLGTPVAAILFAWCHLRFQTTYPWYTWGWVSFVHTFVVYLGIANAGRCYSVDRIIATRIRKARGIEEPPPTTVVAWPIRMMQLHIGALYLAAGWHRIDDGPWLRGEMVYEALVNTTFGRFPHFDLQPYKWALWLGNWGALILELLAPIQLYRKDSVRIPWTLGLMGMHIGLELTSTVGWWQYFMTSMLILFLPEEWFELRRWRRGWGRFKSDPRSSGTAPVAEDDQDPSPSDDEARD